MMFDRHRYDIRWRFVPAPADGKVAWHWEIWTPSGVFVVRSNDTFDSRDACEENALHHGYSVAPAR